MGSNCHLGLYLNQSRKLNIPEIRVAALEQQQQQQFNVLESTWW